MDLSDLLKRAATDWRKSILQPTSGSAATVNWLTAHLNRPDDVDPEESHLVLAWAHETISKGQGQILVRSMIDDIGLFLWTLKLLEHQTSRAKDRLWALIEASHAFLLTISQTGIPDRGIMRGITVRRQEALFLTVIMVDNPIDEIQEYLEACLNEDKAFRIQVRVIIEKMLHTLSSSADNERLRVRLTRVKSISAQFDRDTDTRSHSQSPDNSHQQAATRAATSPEPPRRSDPSIGGGMVPRSSTAAAETQLAGPSLQQADPSPPPDQIGDLSIRQGDPSPPSYQKGDLIDRVASRKASREQLRSFKNQALSKETFYQQALDRVDIYSSRSEEEKRKKLRAMLESVRKERTKSKESPTKKEPATAQPPASSATGTPPNPSRTMTREEKLAIQFRDSTALQRRFCEELEKVISELSLTQASTEAQRGIQVYRKKAASQLEDAKRAHLPADPAGANPARGTAEAGKAYEELYRVQTRFTELQMLAAVSGAAAKEAAEKITAKLSEASVAAASEARARWEARSESPAGPSQWRR
ncbi:hypothetical protein GJ744_000896 [Endocarpon pusillum]|uniref:Uncharacterized protein n=1 Tax=Endocarpon pusillum TaxID=364733 RepID=A0A8H7E8S1_9EURO|nr:hypothetical protein GJ744_000896 [Endocarpon pusillum]